MSALVCEIGKVLLCRDSKNCASCCTTKQYILLLQTAQVVRVANHACGPPKNHIDLSTSVERLYYTFSRRHRILRMRSMGRPDLVACCTLRLRLLTLFPLLVVDAQLLNHALDSLEIRLKLGIDILDCPLYQCTCYHSEAFPVWVLLVDLP